MSRNMHCRTLGSLFTLTLLLLSLVGYTHLLSAPAAYADDHKHNSEGNSNKVKNQSLMNQVSDKIVSANIGTNKATIQEILQLIQDQMVQTSGQDKATKALNLLDSILKLNPNGQVSQSLLNLAKEQASEGSTQAIQ